MQSWLTEADEEKRRAATGDRTVLERMGGDDAADGDGIEHLLGCGGK